LITYGDQEKVPEWIDVAVHSENGHQTIVSLLCCGQFSANEKNLYHRQGGLAPFSIKSPYFPARWESVEKSGRFDLAALSVLDEYTCLSAGND
jgi:hypothetical protein